MALVLFLVGCILHFGEEELACDTMAVGSVNLGVSMTDGGDAGAAVATWSNDGGASFQPCDAFGGAGEFTCGWEAAGDLVVRVDAVGYESREEDVFVEQGICHVEPVHLDLALEPVEGVDCTAEEVTSVIAIVAGSGGEELSGVWVGWGYPDTDGGPRDCQAYEDGTWACASEVAGELEIWASADGHETELQAVTVGADECHVITEYVSFELDWLPD